MIEGIAHSFNNFRSLGKPLCYKLVLQSAWAVTTATNLLAHFLKLSTEVDMFGLCLVGLSIKNIQTVKPESVLSAKSD